MSQIIVEAHFCLDGESQLLFLGIADLMKLCHHWVGRHTWRLSLREPPRPWKEIMPQTQKYSFLCGMLVSVRLVVVKEHLLQHLNSQALGTWGAYNSQFFRLARVVCWHIRSPSCFNTDIKARVLLESWFFLNPFIGPWTLWQGCSYRCGFSLPIA